MNSVLKKTNLIKLATMSILLVALSGCPSKQTQPTDGSGISTETTANGGSERMDNSMNFNATGSDSGTIEGLQTVRFGFDSSNLSDGEEAKLKGNAAWLNKNSSATLTIEGHCDQRGSTEYNLSLGERRANAVKQMLVNMGVSADRLRTTSMGKEKPLSSGDSEEAMAQNRRANFVPSK